MKDERWAHTGDELTASECILQQGAVCVLTIVSLELREREDALRIRRSLGLAHRGSRGSAGRRTSRLAWGAHH